MKLFTPTALCLFLSLVLTSCLPPKRSCDGNHSGNIVSGYDQQTNQTTVKLEKIRITSDYTWSELAANFTYSGQTPSQPEEARITLFTPSEAAHRRDEIMTVQADSQRFTLERDAYQYDRPNGIPERMSFPVSWGNFEKMAYAQGVEMTLGEKKFRLGREQLAALCDLASRIKP